MGVEPVELTDKERETLEVLAQALGAEPLSRSAFHLHQVMREIARAEVASLAGLVLRRTQVQDLTRVPEHNIAEEVVNSKLASIFGEVLSEYGHETLIEEASEK